MGHSARRKPHTAGCVSVELLTFYIISLAIYPLYWFLLCIASLYSYYFMQYFSQPT